MLRVLGIRHAASGRSASASGVQAVFARIKGGIGRIAATASRWKERSERRRRLHDLDAHLRRDIGIGRREVLSETSKPFWRD